MKNFPDAGYSGESILTYLDNTTGNLYDGISEKLAEDAGLTPSQIGSMSDPVFKPKYGMYILGEQGRVKTFYELMKSGQYGSLGSLITSTHYDMSDVYEAGTAKNTEIVNILAELGISGRIVGAGFGGFNMFFILGDTPEQRSETYTLAETALAQHGFNRCFKAPPGCGSAVFETE
jgi:galactokinase